MLKLRTVRLGLNERDESRVRQRRDKKETVEHAIEKPSAVGATSLIPSKAVPPSSRLT